MLTARTPNQVLEQHPTGLITEGITHAMTNTPDQSNSEDPPEESNKATEGQEKPDEKPAATFTQEDLDRIVRDRVKRERDKYADYEDLKAKAQGTATAEERIANLEKDLENTRTEALRRRIQAQHGISDKDAELFLLGSDEETLTAQAERLVERDSERKKNGIKAPTEGRITSPPAASEKQAFADQLTGHSPA